MLLFVHDIYSNKRLTQKNKFLKTYKRKFLFQKEIRSYHYDSLRQTAKLIKKLKYLPPNEAHNKENHTQQQENITRKKEQAKKLIQDVQIKKETKKTLTEK